VNHNQSVLHSAVTRSIVPIFVIIYAMCSIYLMIPYAIGVVGSGYTGLDSSPYGVQSRPVVYRVLVPTIARVAHALVPASVEEPLTKRMIEWRDSEEGKETVKSLFIRPPPLADDKIFETLVVACVTYLTMLAFIWMLYTLTKALFPESIAYALVTPVIALQLIPALTVENGYIYDFAELFFSCACFYLMFKQRWSAYLLCLFIATFNKETTVFGIFFFTVWSYNKLPRAQFVNLLVAQVFIWIAVKGGVTWYYADKPGIIAGSFFFAHIEYMRVHAAELLINVPCIIFLMVFRWREKPAFLRGGLWMMLPNYAAYLTCVPGEWRDFYWCLPVMLILATHTLISISGIADLAIFRRDAAKNAQ